MSRWVQYDMKKNRVGRFGVARVLTGGGAVLKMESVRSVGDVDAQSI